MKEHIIITVREHKELLALIEKLKELTKPDNVTISINHAIKVIYNDDSEKFPVYRIHPSYINFEGSINFSENTVEQFTELYNKICNEVIGILTIKLEKANTELSDYKKELKLIKSKWWYKLFNRL